MRTVMSKFYGRSLQLHATHSAHFRIGSSAELRNGVAFLRFEQEEMTVLVDQPSAKPKEPIDDRKLFVHDEIGESRLFGDLAPSGLFGCFVTIEVALGEPPVLIAVEDDEKCWALRRASNHHTAGGRFELRLH